MPAYANVEMIQPANKGPLLVYTAHDVSGLCQLDTIASLLSRR
jgi:hypothetical protein